MKQKLCLIASLLALLLLAGCGVSPAEAGESEPSSPSPSTSAPTNPAGPVQTDTPAYYDAYAEIVRNYQQQYGPERIQQIYTSPDMLNYLMGVCVVRLTDFDLDGTLELLLCWPESEEALHSYRYAIWTSLDGTTAEQLCDYEIFDGAQSYCPFLKLISRADGVFLGEDFDSPDVSEAHLYSKVSPSGLAGVLVLRCDPYSGDDGRYLVGNDPVSAADYAKAESDFLAGATVEHIPFVLPDFEDTTPLLDTIRATQEALALLGIEPNPDGLDIAPSAPEQAGYTPYLELIDQYLIDYGQPQVLSSSWFDGRDDTPALGGLCVVRLSDLDGDGTEELILAYVQRLASVGRNISYGFGIWTLRDGAAQELHRASIPYSAYEPSMMLYAGQPGNYMAISYDTNTDEVTSIANVDYAFVGYGYDGERLHRMESRSELPEGVQETEYIYFSSYSYRWAAGMDWDTDSQQVISKTMDTINLLRSST